MENRLKFDSKPVLCRQGCGYYGNQDSCGLCLRCLNNYLKQQNLKGKSTKLMQLLSSESAQENLRKLDEAVNRYYFDVIEIDAGITPLPLKDISSEGGKGKKLRCHVCRKKIGITACRCGKKYCGLHRYSDKHDCTFVNKSAGAAEIGKKNPVVIIKKKNEENLKAYKTHNHKLSGNQA